MRRPINSQLGRINRRMAMPRHVIAIPSVDGAIVRQFTTAALLVLTVGCRPASHTLTPIEYARRYLPDRAKTYVLSIVEILDTKPEMSEGEFIKVITKPGITDYFIDSSGYYKCYEVKVSSNKELWQDNMKGSRLSVVVVIEFKGQESKVRPSLYFNCLGRSVDRNTVPQSDEAKFVTIPISPDCQ